MPEYRWRNPTGSYDRYQGDVGYCDKCNNYSPPDLTACEICGCSDRPKFKTIPTKPPSAVGPGYYDEETTKALYKTKMVAWNIDRHLRQITFVPQLIESTSSWTIKTSTFSVPFTSSTMSLKGPSREKTLATDQTVNSLANALAKRGEVYIFGDNQMVDNRAVVKYIEPGTKLLGSLAMGGRLHIVGHGNAGSAVGTHAVSYDPPNLVRLLADELLPKRPIHPVTIWLMACGAGAHVRRGYVGIRRDPYVKRLAERLSHDGFRNFYVVGFSGFVGIYADITHGYALVKSAESEWRLTEPEDRVVYHLDIHGGVKQTHGGTFKTKYGRSRFYGGWTGKRLKVRKTDT